MNVVTGSLSYRIAESGWQRIGMAARCSLVGRFFLALTRVLGSFFGDSHAFGTRRIGTHRLAHDGHPVSVLAVSRPYLWLRAALGGGAAGRAVQAAQTGMVRSRFAGGAWAWVVGTGLFATGCGWLALIVGGGTSAVDDADHAAATGGLGFVTPLMLLVVGVLVLAAGPRLLPAFRSGLVGRGLVMVAGSPPLPAEAGMVRHTGIPARTGGGTAPRREERLSGRMTVAAGAVLAAVAGVAAGLSSGSGVLATAAVVVSICLFATLVLKPEVMLLVVAAFPWLDWVARRGLGSLGAGWDEALLIFSVILLAWSVIVLRRGELWTVPITLPALLALAAAVGSVVIQDVPSDVALFALRVTFQPLLFYFLGFLFPKDKRWLHAAVTVLIVASVAMALHGLYQYATGAPMPPRWVDVHETDIGTRAYSIIQNPNGLGAFLVIGALLSLSLALAPGLTRIRRGWLAAACVVQLGGVAVTFSRGAWIGLAAGVLALLILAYRRYLAPLVAAGVVAWFVMPQAFVNRLTFAFSSVYITKSLAFGRLYIWKMSLQHIAAHPWFGLGLGTFGGTSAVTFGYGRLWVDNFYLQLAAEGGLLLLALFLWVLLRGAKGLVKGYETTRDPYVRALCAGTFGAFVAVAVANVTASVWETLVVGVGFWFLAGLATSAALQGVVKEADA